MRPLRVIITLLCIAVFIQCGNVHSQDAKALQQATVIPLPHVDGRIDHMDIDLKTQRAFIAALGNNTVEVVSLKDGKRIRTLEGFSEPQGVLFLPELNQLYITNGGSGTCVVLDATSFTRLKTIESLEDADNIRYDKSSKLVYVAYGTGGLAIIDPSKSETIQSLPLTQHPESFQLEKLGNKIYVNIPNENRIVVFDRQTRKMIASWPLKEAEKNFPMALDEAGRRLFIGCRNPAKLLVLDNDSGKTIAVLDIVGDPDDIFYDSGARRIYVTGGGGSISVIRQADADHYAAIADVPTAAGARTSFFDVGAGQLYVLAPHRDSREAHIEIFSTPRPLILKQTIPLPQITGGFNHHSTDSKLRRVFLCASNNKSVEVLDLAAGKIIKSLQQKNKPAATCFTPGINVLSVSGGDTVTLYDGDSFKELAVIATPSSIDELRSDSRTQQLFGGCMTVSNYGIATIDLVQRKLLGITKTPPPQGFCLEDDGKRIFICSPKTDQISIVDRQKSAVIDSIKLTDPKGGNPVAYDSATHRLFVGCRKPAKLLVLNTENGKTVASVDMGNGTDDLSFDPINKRIYVACSQGVISVIQQDDADHYRNTADVSSAPGARNCIFIPESGEFCVTVPQSKDQSKPAEVLIYQAQPTE